MRGRVKAATLIYLAASNQQPSQFDCGLVHDEQVAWIVSEKLKNMDEIGMLRNEVPVKEKRGEESLNFPGDGDPIHWFKLPSHSAPGRVINEERV